MARCKICDGHVSQFGTKWGSYLGRDFRFVRCDGCEFIAVEDPSTEFERLYDERYYEGRGADPSVDYATELAEPERVVRHYEWRGILDIVQSHAGDLTHKRWLDHGSGAGGLVRFARRSGIDCFGFDTGAYAARARAAGVPILDAGELDAMKGTFDVVTLIEVIEHVVDPLPFLRDVANLLRPGGLLFATTGNAAPHVQTFTSWSYVVPEIHVSFFTPKSLGRAYEQAGLEPIQGRFSRGWTDILRFKILKGLGVRRRSPLEAALPWPVLARLAERRFELSAQPLARKPR